VARKRVNFELPWDLLAMQMAARSCQHSSLANPRNLGASKSRHHSNEASIIVTTRKLG